MTRRDDQRDATRQAIVDAALASLVEVGVAASTTVEVQRRAGISRGALLHHFSTREELLGAAIEQLVAVNLRAGREELARAPADADPVSRGLHVMRAVISRPTFGAELELWAAARTNPELRAVLRRTEGLARRDLRDVVDEVFGPDVTSSPNYRLVADLTVQLLRGIAISGALYGETRDREPLLDQWVEVVHMLLAQPADAVALASTFRLRAGETVPG